MDQKHQSHCIAYDGGMVYHETLPRSPLMSEGDCPHMMGTARGGYYHCMDPGCGFKTRDYKQGVDHVSAMRKRFMSQSTVLHR